MSVAAAKEATKSNTEDRSERSLATIPRRLEHHGHDGVADNARAMSSLDDAGMLVDGLDAFDAEATIPPGRVTFDPKVPKKSWSLYRGMRSRLSVVGNLANLFAAVASSHEDVPSELYHASTVDGPAEEVSLSL